MLQDYRIVDTIADLHSVILLDLVASILACPDRLGEMPDSLVHPWISGPFNEIRKIGRKLTIIKGIKYQCSNVSSCVAQ
jgi:hypothetical protein